MEAVGTEEKSWDATLLEQLSAHVQAEREVLAGYAVAAETVEEADVRYLINLIVEDEMRHHRVLEEMVHALEGAMRWEHVDPAVPERTHRPLSPEVRRLTERFLEIERADKRELRDLRRELSPVADTTLWPLLVDLMSLDTDKHLRILEHLAGRPRA